MTPTALIDATPVLDDWWLLRLPWSAEPAAPGQWLWLTINGQRLRLPVRDCHADEQWLAGLVPGALLPQTLRPGMAISASSLQGSAVQPPAQKRLIIVGQDLGIGPALGLAERQASQTRLVIIGGQYGLPARAVPSRFLVPAVADTAIAGVATLESNNIPSRIALSTDRPGVFNGPPLNLLQQYLHNTPADLRADLAVIGFTAEGLFTEFDDRSSPAVSSPL